MKSRTNRLILSCVAAVVLTLSSAGASTAFACPMCKAATEEDDAKPRAYMYSILFMLTVPATLFSGVTAGLVVMGRKESEALEAAGLTDETPEGPDGSTSSDG